MGSSEIVNSGKKSQFSQTCNLLSQLLKKKGSFGDLNNLGIYRTFEPSGSQQTATTTTMNLLPMIEKSGDSSSSSSPEKILQKPMNLFPQQVDISKEQITKNTEPEKAQMTIFYGGQVIVLDDFPADKANEIMKLANKKTNKQNPTNKFAYTMMNNQKSVESVTNFGNKIQELPKCQVPKPCVADLPIARRNSLTRFLEKRKDRITATAPYQIYNNNKNVANSKNKENNKAWLGLGAQFVKTEQYF